MNREDIILMAQEAGLLTEGEAWVSPYQEAMERFAALVAEHEREVCAKVCEDNFSEGALNIADAIRARGGKQDGQCKHCTDGCPACDARKLPKEST